MPKTHITFTQPIGTMGSMSHRLLALTRLQHGRVAERARFGTTPALPRRRPTPRFMGVIQPPL
jgi:hypothetical protein